MSWISSVANSRKRVSHCNLVTRGEEFFPKCRSIKSVLVRNAVWFCLQNLQEDVNRLQQRVKELESSNSSLSSLLLQRIHRNNQSHSNSPNSNTFHSNNSGNRCCKTFACLQSSLCSQLDVFAKVCMVVWIFNFFNAFCEIDLLECMFFQFQKADQQRPVSLDERRLQKIWNKSGSNSFVWVPLQRPQSLNLETSSFIDSEYLWLMSFEKLIALD